MNTLHEFRKSTIAGIRAGIISFILILICDILVFNQENVMNFVLIIIIVFINSFLIGVSTFLGVYSKTMKHLKHIAFVSILLTFFVFIYLQYPFADYLVNPPAREPGEVKISIGKIEVTEFEILTEKKQGSVDIKVG